MNERQAAAEFLSRLTKPLPMRHIGWIALNLHGEPRRKTRIYKKFDKARKHHGMATIVPVYIEGQAE